MTTPRVTPWQDEEPVDANLLNAIKARRPGGKLIGIDRVLLKSAPLATGWNELMVRVRQEFSLNLEYLELIMLRVAWLNKAEFEWNVHYPAYLDAGGTAGHVLYWICSTTRTHNFLTVQLNRREAVFLRSFAGRDVRSSLPSSAQCQKHTL